MERTSFTINFWVSPSKTRKNGLCPIIVTITLNGEKVTFSTHKQISPKDWDNVRQRVKGNTDTAAAINLILEKIRSILLEKELELLDHGFIVTAALIRDAYLNKVSTLQKKTLFQLERLYMDDLKTQVGVKITPSTIYQYERAFDLLHEYVQKKLGRRDVFAHI